MTISYSGNFFRLLVRWKGGVWNAIWKELIIWLALFYIIRFILDYGVPDYYQQSVANVVALFNTYTLQLPLEILLGFYVSHVVRTSGIGSFVLVVYTSDLFQCRSFDGGLKWNMFPHQMTS